MICAAAALGMAAWAVWIVLNEWLKGLSEIIQQ
jgi:hypothetical protein